MILVTGATGTVGRALVPKLLERGDEVRVLVRDPRKLGRLRVEVRIALGDLGELGDPRVARQALRGVDTVIHLAAAIRDQPRRVVEEINGLGTARLLRAAESTGVSRFVFFSAIGATEFQRTRFFRAKALAERAVRASELDTTVFAPSIVYDHDDPWVTMMRRLTLLAGGADLRRGAGGLPADLGRRRRPAACSPTSRGARARAASSSRGPRRSPTTRSPG